MATEIEVIGEAEFPEGLGPVVLHLFSDELSIHYQVHIDPEDLISTERLPKDEAKQIVAEREARLLAGQEKRKVERAERRAKRSAELARQRERQRKGLTKSSSRSRLTKSKKKSEGRYVGRSLPSMDEAMRGVEDELGSLEERLAALESESTKSIAELRALSAIDHSYRPARQLLGELQELSGRIESIAKSCARLIARYERFQESVESGQMKRRDFDAELIRIDRLVDKYDTKMLELHTSHRAYTLSMEDVTTGAQGYQAEVEQLARAERERDAKAAAERKAKRVARQRARKTAATLTRSNRDSGGSGANHEVSSARSLASAGAASKSEAAAARETASRKEDPPVDNEPVDLAAVSADSGSRILFAGAGLALAVVALFLLAARSAGGARAREV